MDQRRFNTSANTSLMQRYAVDKAFQSLLEESIIYEGPIIQKRFHPNRTDLNLSSARADLFSSIKNKTFDKGWRQEVAKKSMSFSQNQSHMSSFPVNHSSWRNVSNIHNIGNHMTGVVSKKPTLSPHQESPAVSKSKSSAKISSFKMPWMKNPSLKMFQDEDKRLEKHLKETSKRNLRSRAKDLVTNLQPQVLVKDLKIAGKTTQKKQRASDEAKNIRYRPSLATKDAIDMPKIRTQKKNLVQSIQSHEMVSNIQKEKLRSFAANLMGKCNSQLSSSTKTVIPQLAASEVPTISSKRKRSSHRTSLKEPIPKRRKLQNTDLNIQKTDPKAQKTEPRRQKTEPKTQKAEPKTQKPEPKTQKTESKTQKTEPKTQKTEPKTQKPDPKVQNYETLTKKPNTRLQVSQVTTLKTEPKRQDLGSSPNSLPKSNIKERYLDKWIVYHDENNDFFIKGHVKDCSPNTFRRSAPIVRRIENSVLETQSGTNIIISGPPYTAAMLSKGYTQDIINRFQNGFPVTWRSILIGNQPSNSKITEKNLKLDEGRTRKPPVKVVNNLKPPENNTPIPETASTLAKAGIPSENHLQDESSILDEISNPSDDDELTEMESTASDLLKLLEVKHKNNVSNGYVNNFENSSMFRVSNNCFVKLKTEFQQNIQDLKSYKKQNKSENRHGPSGLQLKKQITDKELKMKKQQSVEKSLDSDNSEESSLSDSDFSAKPRKKYNTTKKAKIPKRKSASPSKTSQSSLKRKVSSPTKGASPTKQKQLNPESRKGKTPPKKLTSKKGKSSPKKTGNPKTRVRSVSKASAKDSAPVTKSYKANEKTGRDSSSQNKTKETKSKKPTKSATQNKKKEIWSEAELKAMMRAMSKLSPSDQKFWSKVAQKVGKSVTECKNQFYNNELSSDKIKEPQNAKNKKCRKSPQPKIDKDEAEHSQDDFEDDLFESENVKKNSKNLNFNPEDKLEDIFGDLCAFTPQSSSNHNFQSSMSKFFLTPVSERHTPASSFSDMEVKIDWDNATHCIKNFKKNQSKGAGRLKQINKKLDLQNLKGPHRMKPLDIVSELNKLNDIPMKPKTNTENVADDSDQLSYFSDSDIN